MAVRTLATRAKSGWEHLCPICWRPFTLLSGGLEGCAIHGIREDIRKQSKVVA